MSGRAIALGLLLGLLVSGLTFFNDAIIRQSWFINHHLPLSVFGTLVVLILLINPLLRCIGSWLPLRPTELAVIVAIGLAACGWPSFGFFWGFVPNVSMPLHQERVRPSWQANELMSYIPGGSGRLAPGQVRHWPTLVRRMIEAHEASPNTGLGRVWERIGPQQREHWTGLLRDARDDPHAAQALRAVINRHLEDPQLFDAATREAAPLSAEARMLHERLPSHSLTTHGVTRLNRWTLHNLVPEVVAAPPQGDGVLLANADTSTPILSTVLLGASENFTAAMRELPWRTWWPTLRLWGGLALLVGMASLCLTLIVHPQWSRHELQPYPIARFVSEMTRQSGGRSLPDLFRRQPFWLGFVAMIALHGLNGAQAWFPNLPHIPLRLDFTSLADLFPSVRGRPTWDVIFGPSLTFSVVAFALFLRTPVAFSVGIAPYAYLVLGGVFASYGVTLGEDRFSVSHGGLLRFGAYLGMAGVILYLGRRYYATVARGALIGLSGRTHVPAYAVWAARGLALAVVLAVAMLRTVGVSWVLGLMFVALVLMMMLVMTRIVVETGIFFLQSWWVPVVMLTALMGVEAIGPTTYIVLAVGSILLVGDPRTALMPYLANALQMTDRSGAAPVRVGPWLMVMIVIGLVTAAVATLGLTQAHGAVSMGPWAVQTLPAMPFDRLTLLVNDMTAAGTLTDAVHAQGLERLALVRFDGMAYRWMFVGMLLVIGAAAASLRLPWWPIHPVLFLIWGTMPASRLGLSFLLGWLVKLAVVKLGGARAHRQAMPLAVGVIAGELLAGLLWILIGGIYYFITGQSPVSYRVHL